VEIRALQARQRIGKVEDAALRRRVRRPRSGDLESLLPKATAAPLRSSDENEVGPKSHSQRKADFSPSSKA